MQEPGRPPFAGVDLRRPKGYPAADSTAPADAETATEAHGGDPCPRCESRDTKFCYYNNYNTSQPRHYCRSCRRYWTKGGSLRNVPVGGGSRKANSSSSSSSASASPRRAKNSKRRRVALAAPPEAEPEPSTVDDAGAAEEAVVGAVGNPNTDVDAARATANSTVGDPATAVDAVRTGAAKANNGTSGNPATAEAAAHTEATANDTVDDPAIAVDAATTGTATTEDAVTADDPADGGFTDHPSVALGLGTADAGGKEEPDLSPFEWPSGCDLGSYWASAPGVFADTADPVLFLNLP
jgi:hypothetical protein